MRAAIWGTGLMGASVGMALRAAGWHVAGWDTDAEAASRAQAHGALDEVAPSPELRDATLLVLAAPPEATVEHLQRLDTDVLVTDLCGVKGPIVDAAAHLEHFVGSHPMAGRASSGPSFASANLFRGATWILTTDNASDSDVDRLSDVVESISARPVRMTAAAHDAAIAKISHLPHVLAAALLGVAERDDAAMGLVAGGFRDITRVAASDPGWWSEVLSSNRRAVGEAIDLLAEELDAWRRLLDADHEAIDVRLSAARDARLGLSADVTFVHVVLWDQPGELARVGKALERSGADIRDIQLRHGEHGGGGVLTLSVHPNDVQPLRDALDTESFQTE